MPEQTMQPSTRHSSLDQWWPSRYGDELGALNAGCRDLAKAQEQDNDC